MKIKWLFKFGFAALLLLFQPIMATPLINSQFARANPGKIPYSSCRLQGHMIAAVDTGLMGATGGVELAWLKCYSKKYGLTTKIPVRMSSSIRIGLALGIVEGFLDLSVTNLHGKTIRQLFDEYKGWSGGLANLELQRHRNVHKISISGFLGGNGFGLALPGYGRFHLSIPDLERLQRFRDDPYVLFSKTVYGYTEESYLVQNIQPLKKSRNKRRGFPSSLAKPGESVTLINLMVADGEAIPFSIDGSPSIGARDYKKFRPRLVSQKGESIHLMDKHGIRLQRANGSWAYQNLQGTFDFRDADELEPDFDQLFFLRFVKDDAENVDGLLLVQEEELEYCKYP